MVKILLEKEVLISENDGSGVAKIQSEQLTPHIGTRVKLIIEVGVSPQVNKSGGKKGV